MRTASLAPGGTVAAAMREILSTDVLDASTVSSVSMLARSPSSWLLSSSFSGTARESAR